MYPIVLSAPSEPGDLAFSALPDAPVVPDRATRRRSRSRYRLSDRATRTVRTGLATTLRGLAAAVEPEPRPRSLRG